MESAFRLGLAGAGRMGRNHLQAVASSDAVRVVAVAEPSEAARTRAAGPGVALFGDAAQMIVAGGFDTASDAAGLSTLATSEVIGSSNSDRTTPSPSLMVRE